ncbi:MAG: hypothetical protein R6V49_09410 [Bacteroidales bacterium]
MKNRRLTLKDSVFFIALLSLIGFLACSEKDSDPVAETYLTFKVPNDQIIITADHATFVVTASGGTLPYEFYLVPDEQWSSGDLMYEKLQKGDLSKLHKYTYSRSLYGSHSYIFEVDNSHSYWVAVQDGAESAPTYGTNLYAWWKKVTIP